MSRKKPIKMGRQEIPIDWNFVDEYLEAECSGVEVAAQLGCHPETLYNRCLDEKGETFTSYSAKKKAKGDACIRKVQYDALKAGDKTMLVWLGKNRLKQRDRHDVQTSTYEPHVQKLLAYWEALPTEQPSSDT